MYFDQEIFSGGRVSPNQLGYHPVAITDSVFGPSSVTGAVGEGAAVLLVLVVVETVVAVRVTLGVFVGAGSLTIVGSTGRVATSVASLISVVEE